MTGRRLTLFGDHPDRPPPSFNWQSITRAEDLLQEICSLSTGSCLDCLDLGLDKAQDNLEGRRESLGLCTA